MQWGMKLANSISDYVAGIHSFISDLVTVASHCGTVFKGRRMSWHFTDSEGNRVPMEDRSEQLSLESEEK